MRNYLKFYIDGAWVDPLDPRTLDVIDPATLETVRSIEVGLQATGVGVVMVVANVRNDPVTFDLTSACQWLSYSDDKGATWVNNPLACGSPPVDHQTIVAAPPRDRGRPCDGPGPRDVRARRPARAGRVPARR